MKNLAICISVLLAAVLHQPSEASKTGNLGECGTANGYACVSDTEYVGCINYKLSGSTPKSCGGTLKCFPGEGTPCNIELTTTCNGVTTGNFSITDRCRNYYTCVSDTIQLVLACSEGEEFSDKEKKCVAKAISGCSKPVLTTSSPSGFCFPLTRQTDPTSCRHYYLCTVLGARSRVQCPFNMFYDTTFHKCRFVTDCGSRPK